MMRLKGRVEGIYLAGPKLRRITLEALSCLAEAEEISLNACDFSDQDVRHLDKLTKLRELHLSATNITAAGLDDLAMHHQLERLALNNTSVGDESVDVLCRMQSLRKLHLLYTRISKQGMTRLLAGLPKCEIFRDTSSDLPTSE
jgi:hypothetical protein